MHLNFDTFSIAFAFFLLMDALGNVPIFLSVLKDFPPQKQRKIILRELIIALLVIVLFYFLGEFLLNLLHISQHSILIGGGIILFLISIRMIFPEFFREPPAHSNQKEPFIVPLAIPLIAGPAILASVMLYSQQGDPPFVILSALFLAWLFSTVILLCSSHLQKILGSRGLTACEKLMGLLLTLIAVQMFLEGISLYTCGIK